MTAAHAARALAAIVLVGAAHAAAGQEWWTNEVGGEVFHPDDVARGRVELRLGVASFDYVETYQGRTLDREDGFLPALTGEAEVRWRWAFGRFGFRIAGGSVRYTGEVQAPTLPSLDGVPVTGQSEALQLEERVEAGVHVDPGRRVALYVGLGVRSWRRAIQDMTATARDGTRYLVPGYDETYSWGEAEVGARGTLLDRRDDTWDLEARLVRTVAPRLDVDYLGSPVSLALKTRLGWRAATSYRHAFTPSAYLVAALWGEGYAFGASDVDPVHGILEPDSRTLRFGLELGVGFR